MFQAQRHRGTEKSNGQKEFESALLVLILLSLSLRVSVANSLRLVDLRFRQNRSHLKNRNHRQEANEQKQQGKEESNRADEHCPIPNRATIKSPRRWQK